MEKEDLYVIGFPKSGNTWLARLIAEVTNAKIYVKSEGDVVNNSENTIDKKGKYLIHKIHGTNDLQKVLTSPKVYILRDPRDVFVSGFFHNYRNITEEMIQKTWIYRVLFNLEVSNLNKSWNKTLRARKNYWIKKVLGNSRLNVGGWSEHVRFWSALDGIAVIKYENLLEDPLKELKYLFQKLDINVDDKILQNAIYNQSFEKKKKNFLENGDMENAKFLRSGKKESWRTLVDKELQTKIEKAHKTVMDKYGYQVDIKNE